MKKIAVIGCGAIADSFHLPALKRFEGGGLDIVLVDPDLPRAEDLGRKHGVAECLRSHEGALGGFDAAVVTSPAHTHASIVRDCLEAGVPVLCEKPLGTSVAEVEGLAELARETRVTLAVNQTRRFIPACISVREIVSSGRLGDEISVTVREGDRFDWPAATPAMFGTRSQGRGVLLDIGVHVLDLMAWWFGPDLKVVDYADDSFGGSEARASCVLEGSDCRIDIELSWLQKQQNRYQFQGSRGRLTWGVYDLDEVRLADADGAGSRTLSSPDAPRSFAGLAPRVLADFARAVQLGSAPTVGPDDVLPSMRLIEECYARRRQFDMPWHDFQMEPDHA